MKTFNKGDIVSVDSGLATATGTSSRRGEYPAITTQTRAKAGKTAVVTGISERNGFVELDGDEGVFYHPSWLTDVPTITTTVSRLGSCTVGALSTDCTTTRAPDAYTTNRTIEAYIPTCTLNTHTTKEKKSMSLKKLLGSIRYGKVTDGSVRMSMNGPAFRNAENVYVSYDKTTGHITNVDIASFEADGLAYYIPTPIESIVAGDYIDHNNKPCCVIDASDGVLTVINVYSGVAETITPTKNLFGGCFVSKIASLFDGFQTGAQSSQFSGLLPLLLLSDRDSKGSSSKFLPFLLMSQMNGGAANGGNMLANPWMLMFMMDGADGDMESLLPMLMMGGALGQTAPAAVEKAAVKPGTPAETAFTL